MTRGEEETEQLRDAARSFALVCAAGVVFWAFAIAGMVSVVRYIAGLLS